MKNIAKKNYLKLRIIREQALTQLESKLIKLKVSSHDDIYKNKKVRNAIKTYLVQTKIVPIEADFKTIKDKRVIAEILLIVKEELTTKSSEVEKK